MFLLSSPEPGLVVVIGAVVVGTRQKDRYIRHIGYHGICSDKCMRQVRYQGICSKNLRLND